MSRLRDILGVIRGCQLVAEAGVKLQVSNIQETYKNSSLKPALNSCLQSKPVQSSASGENVNKNVNNIVNILSDGVDRLSTVSYGIKEYILLTSGIKGEFS